MYKHKNILYPLKNLISLLVLKLSRNSDSKLILTELSLGELAIIFLIHIYQLFSACFPAKCRFYPTCSNYMIHSVAKYGLIKGTLAGTVRICKCHPFHPGGYDPVK